MAVPQYQVSSSSNVGRKGTLLRIRPTLQKNLTFPCGTVITVPYIGESKVLELVISGYDLIFKSESIVSESQRLLGFFAFVFFVLIIFSLFIVSLSYFKKSKAYYKIALGTIITTVSVTLLVGLLGQYYKIVQGINIEFIGDLLKGEVSNIDKIVKFEVESTSFIYFIQVISFK